MSAIDSILKKIVEVATMVKNGDCPEQYLYFKLEVSWKRKLYVISASADRGQHIRTSMPEIFHEQGQIDTTDYNDVNIFIGEMSPELKNISLIHKNISIAVVDSDTSKGVFSCQGSLVIQNMSCIFMHMIDIVTHDPNLNISVERIKKHFDELMKIEKVLEEINQAKRDCIRVIEESTKLRKYISDLEKMLNDY